MTRLHLLEKVKQRKEEIGLSIDSLSKLSQLGNRTVTRFLSGEDVKLSAKRIVIRKIEIEGFDLPEIKLRITCGKGTYIRALARDIGEELNCGAYLTALERTRIGNYNLKDAFKVSFFLENLNLDETN